MKFFNRHPHTNEAATSTNQESPYSAESTAEAGKVALQGNVAIEVHSIDTATSVEVQQRSIGELDERLMLPETIAAEDQLRIDSHIDGYE